MHLPFTEMSIYRKCNFTFIYWVWTYVVSHGAQRHVGMMNEAAGRGIITSHLVVERLQALGGTVAKLLGHVVYQIGLLVRIQVDRMHGQLALWLLRQLWRTHQQRVRCRVGLAARTILIERYVRVVHDVVYGHLLHLIRVVATVGVYGRQQRKRVRSLSSL